VTISDEQFASLISRAMDDLPQEYIKGLNNVVVTYDDVPTEHQRTKMKLRHGDALYGLYEGIPMTQRGAGYNLVLPDKITIFKYPMIEIFGEENALYNQVKHTLWHEIAHFYGLNHDKIHEIEAHWS
jgi:predicted Zn-dependent protease with MMP-like domain